MQVAPIPALFPFIKHYLFLESNVNYIKKFRLFSDGNNGIVLTIQGNLSGNSENEVIKDYPNSFLYGQITNFKDLYFSKNARIIIVVFQPYGLNRMLGIAGNEIKDNAVDITNLFGKQSVWLQESLVESIYLESRVQILNDFFLEFVSKKNILFKSIIEVSLNFIQKNNGNISNKQLTKFTGYSERQLERIFNECIGLTPKKFGNIIRLYSFLNLLKKSSNDNYNLSSMGYEIGFFDQSHLIKEFKKFTGLTPTQYVSNTNKITRIFFEMLAN